MTSPTATSASKAASAGSTSTASRSFAVLLFAVAAMVTACTGSSPDSLGSSLVAEVAGATTQPTDELPPEPAPAAPGNRLRPGNNTPVVVGRGDGLDSHFQAAVYLRLLRELGYRAEYYTAGDGSGLAPDQAYQALALRQVDVWPGGLFPLHVPFLADPVAGGDGEPVANRVSVVGEQTLGGLVEGVLVSRDWALANDIAYLDDIAANPAAAAELDVDGDGTADIFGCGVGTTCQILIDRLISQSAWPFTQIVTAAGDGSILDAAVARIGAGQPTLVFGRSPGESLARLAPGVATVWLSVRQPVEGQSNDANLEPRMCPGSPCNTGFPAADILAVANIDFLIDNPPARVLLERIQLTAAEVSQQNIGITEDTSSADLDNGASRWITDNRETINEWLEAARSAA